VAIEVKKILTQEGLLSQKRRGRHQFYVSDNPEWFSSLASTFLGRDIQDVRKADSCV
jgi:glutamate racemase